MTVNSCDNRPGRNFVANIRTYDQDGFKQRSACICFRDVSEREVLLVSSSSDPHTWVVPGGGVEPEELPCCAARRELHEEAGAIGPVHRFVGVFIENEGNETRKTKTYVFTLNANALVDTYEDNERIGRQRKWFSLDEARRELRARPTSLSYLTEAVNYANSKSETDRPSTDLEFDSFSRCSASTASTNHVDVNVNKNVDLNHSSPCKCGFRWQLHHKEVLRTRPNRTDEQSMSVSNSDSNR